MATGNRSRKGREAGAGIEPANSGFADRDLTTWLPRRVARAHNIVVAALVSSAERGYIGVRAANDCCVIALTLQRIRLSCPRDVAVFRTICSCREAHPRRCEFA